MALFVIALGIDSQQMPVFAKNTDRAKSNSDLADRICTNALAQLKARENVPLGPLSFESSLRTQVRSLLNSPQQSVRLAAEKIIEALDSSKLGKVTLFLLLREYAKSDHVNDEFLDVSISYISYILTEPDIFNEMLPRDQELALQTYEDLFKQLVIRKPDILEQLFLARQEEFLDLHKLKLRTLQIAAATQAYVDLYNDSTQNSFHGENSLSALQIKDALYRVRTEWLPEVRLMFSEEERSFILRSLSETGEIISNIAHQTPAERDKKVASEAFHLIDQIGLHKLELRAAKNTMPSTSKFLTELAGKSFVDQRQILNSLLSKWESSQESWIRFSEKLSGLLESTTDLALKKQLILAFAKTNQEVKELRTKILDFISDKDFKKEAERLGFSDYTKILDRKLRATLPSFMEVRHRLLSEGLASSSFLTAYQMMEALEVFEKHGLIIQDIPMIDLDLLSEISNAQTLRKKLAFYVDLKLDANVFILMRDSTVAAQQLQKNFETESFESLDFQIQDLKFKLSQIDKLEARLSQELWYEFLDPKLKWMKLQLIRRLRKTKSYIEKNIIDLQMPIDHQGFTELLELQNLIYDSPQENILNRLLMASENPKDLEERMKIILQFKARNQDPTALSETNLQMAAAASNARELSELLFRFFSLDMNESSED